MSDIQKLAEDMNIETRSYSGRGMMGRTCLGIVVDDETELFALFYSLGAHNMKMPFGPVRTDNMGFSTIYYWPLEEYVESEDDEEYDDGYGECFDDDDDENED